MKKSIIQGFALFVLFGVIFNQVLTINAQIVNTNPCLNFRETDKTLPLGLWRVCVGDDQFAIQQNTASNGSFGTLTTVLSVTGGVVTFLGGTGGGGSSVFANDIYLASTGIGIGVRVGKGPSTAITNTMMGNSTFGSMTTGAFNTAVGYANLISCTNCSYNTAFGTQNQYYLVTNHGQPFGNRNASFGYAAMTNCGFTSGTCDNNAAFGFAAMSSIDTGTDNACVGHECLRFSTSGSFNNAFGSASNRGLGFINSFNNSFGASTLYNNIADNNSAFGHASLIGNTSGTQNSCFGGQCLYYNTTGSYNNALGFNAGLLLTNGVGTSSTTTQSLFLGNDTRAGATDGLANQIVIGHAAISYGANAATIGNASLIRWVPGANGSVDLGAVDRVFPKGYVTTVIGNSATTSSLILQSTSGVGVGSDNIQMRVGNNGATLALIANTGGVTVDVIAATTGTFVNNINIGGTTTYAVDIVKSSTSNASGTFPGFRMRNSSTATASNADIVLWGNNTAVEAAFRLDGLATIGILGAAGAYIGTDTNHAFGFTTNNLLRATITSAGVFGITSTLTINTSGTGGSFNHTGKHYWTGGTAELATGNALCQATTSEVQVNAATTCLVSSKRYKHDDKDITLNDAKNIVFKLRSIDYIFNGQDNKGRRFGFFAEDAAIIDKRLVEYDELGRPNSFRYEEYTSVLTKVIQDMEKRILKLEKK